MLTNYFSPLPRTQPSFLSKSSVFSFTVAKLRLKVSFRQETDSEGVKLETTMQAEVMKPETLSTAVKEEQMDTTDGQKEHIDDKKAVKEEPMESCDSKENLSKLKMETEDSVKKDDCVASKFKEATKIKSEEGMDDSEGLVGVKKEKQEVPPCRRGSVIVKVGDGVKGYKPVSTPSGSEASVMKDNKEDGDAKAIAGESESKESNKSTDPSEKVLKRAPGKGEGEKEKSKDIVSDERTKEDQDGQGDRPEGRSTSAVVPEEVSERAPRPASAPELTVTPPKTLAGEPMASTSSLIPSQASPRARTPTTSLFMRPWETAPAQSEKESEEEEGEGTSIAVDSGRKDGQVPGVEGKGSVAEQTQLQEDEGCKNREAKDDDSQSIPEVKKLVDVPKPKDDISALEKTFQDKEATEKEEDRSASAELLENTNMSVTQEKGQETEVKDVVNKKEVSKDQSGPDRNAGVGKAADLQDEEDSKKSPAEAVLEKSDGEGSRKRDVMKEKEEDGQKEADSKAARSEQDEDLLKGDGKVSGVGQQDESDGKTKCAEETDLKDQSEGKEKTEESKEEGSKVEEDGTADKPASKEMEELSEGAKRETESTEKNKQEKGDDEEKEDVTKKDDGVEKEKTEAEEVVQPLRKGSRPLRPRRGKQQQEEPAETKKPKPGQKKRGRPKKKVEVVSSQDEKTSQDEGFSQEDEEEKESKKKSVYKEVMEDEEEDEEDEEDEEESDDDDEDDDYGRKKIQKKKGVRTAKKKRKKKRLRYTPKRKASQKAVNKIVEMEKDEDEVPAKSSYAGKNKLKKADDSDWISEENDDTPCCKCGLYNHPRWVIIYIIVFSLL